MPLYSFANGVGNGGDICENRFTSVRNDIHSWILLGGSAGLSLPQGISFAEYNQSMLANIASAKVSCTDQKLTIGQAEKTCINYSSAGEQILIVCNTNRFMNTSENDQYILVHHEYAGLSGFEVNAGESSDYRISNQISGYLENAIVKKLVVRPSAPPTEDVFNPNICTDSPMTTDDARKYFGPGDVDASAGVYGFQARINRCVALSGCEPTKPWEGFRARLYKMTGHRQSDDPDTLEDIRDIHMNLHAISGPPFFSTSIFIRSDNDYQEFPLKLEKFLDETHQSNSSSYTENVGMRVLFSGKRYRGRGDDYLLDTVLNKATDLHVGKDCIWSRLVKTVDAGNGATETVEIVLYGRH
jgi:hypothetical protein